jgi:hypothetical protein
MQFVGEDWLTGIDVAFEKEAVGNVTWCSYPEIFADDSIFNLWSEGDSPYCFAGFGLTSPSGKARPARMLDSLLDSILENPDWNGKCLYVILRDDVTFFDSIYASLKKKGLQILPNVIVIANVHPYYEIV